MKELHPEDDLREPVDDDGLGKAAPSFPLSREERREVAPGAVRHDDVHAVPVDEGLDALEDARVVHALHDGHLAQAHLALEFLRGELHLLQDHLGGVGRRGDATSEEDPAVAPLADLAGDLVVANHRDGHGDGRKPEADAPSTPRARRRSRRLGSAATLGEAGGLTRRRTETHGVAERRRGRESSSGGSVSGRPATRRAVAFASRRTDAPTFGARRGLRASGVRATGRRASETRARRSAVVVVVCYSDVCFETCASSRARRRIAAPLLAPPPEPSRTDPELPRVAPHTFLEAPRIHLDALTPREASDLERG